MLREIAQPPEEQDFRAILTLIQGARQRVWHAANLAVVELYWHIGEYISRKVTEQGWGRSTVQQLSAWLLSREIGLRGFSASNLWRMRQLFDTYATDPKLARWCENFPGH